jgi:hypothetical protein
MKLRKNIFLLIALLTIDPLGAWSADATDNVNHSFTAQESCTHGPVQPGIDTVPKFDDILFVDMSPDEEATIAKILTSESFFMPWARLADYLGYGWVGGNTNGNREVGREMEYRRIQSTLDNFMPDNEYRYMFNAKYDPEHPDGYWAEHRFRMAFSKIQWMMEPESLKLGDPLVYDKKPIKVVTALLENYSNLPDTGVATLSYSSTVSWSKTDSVSVNSKISITKSMKFGIPLVAEDETSVSVEVGQGENWSTTNGGSTTTSETAEYRAIMPPRSQRLITLILFEQKADVPYRANMFMSYNAELYNFLRWSGNGLRGHPDNRPFYLAKFGGAKDGLNAPQDLLSQYINPAISMWDWQWVTNEFCTNRVQNRIGEIAKRKFRQQFSGVFTALDSTHYKIIAGEAKPLDQKGKTSTGMTYRLLSDLRSVPGQVENLHFSLKRPSSSISPFK